MRDSALKWGLLAPAILISIAMLFYPIGRSFWYSLHDWNLTISPQLGPFIGLDNYVRLLTDDPQFWHSVWVSCVFSFFSVFTTIVVSMLMALLLQGSRQLEINVRSILVLAFAMSPALVGISWRFLLAPEFGAADAVIGWIFPRWADVPILADTSTAMVALVLVDVWHWAPYFMLTFIGALASLPQETIEAGQIDGAGRFRIFFGIVLPQLKGVLAIAILLKTIFSIKMLEQVITMTSGGPGSETSTVPHKVYETAFKFYDFGYAAAMAYFLAAAMLVLAMIYSRMLFGGQK
ncbi:carbohydrate ABC transporter permease [Primorskyibacter flagellatus]|uniref:Carbohydrate ABC transporter membrane protein 1, CUT1 family n=1 Tax=Primorskyibacter flagellatus TaxID=1387277 RepID=A0A1W2EF57_9RHOB|nr:sugar ABC transporter permease [Primorskyibacter flagellatus]SMD07926.1 carbohydrate ABC transporter membrane protein 1, CUT1 family [Primorskyibacter flagellatus]